MKTKTLPFNYIDTFFSNNLLRFGPTEVKSTRLFLALFVSVLSIAATHVQGQSQTFSDPTKNGTTNTFTVPAGVTQITVETWGGGGAGGAVSTNGTNVANGGGGAGGAYAKKLLTVTPGSTYTVNVASSKLSSNTGSAIDNNGNPSIFLFGSTELVKSLGGAGGAPFFLNNGGSGIGGVGTSTGSLGDAGSVNAGGSGTAGSAGGAGGGGAGSTGLGGNASGATGGVGASLNGGNGANGVAINNVGSPGNNYGGGGSGARTTGGTLRLGGAGAQGLVVVSWPTITSLGATSTCAGSPIQINGANLSGATSVTIGGTPAAIITNTATQITATVGNGTTGTVTVVTASGTVTSAATFTVNTPPSITTQPSTATQTVCPNGAASLSVAATGTGVTYQWYSNTTASNSGGSLISGATAATYTPVTSTPGTLYYYVVVSGTCTPAVTSNVSGAIVVNTPPAITTQPLTATQTVCPNGAASLSVAATGTGVTYQWYSNTTASNSGGSLISGATAATYTPVTSTPGTLYYYVVVSATCTPAVTSNVSGAIVVNTPPAITTQPSTATQTVCPNGAASLSVAATGTGVTYQWYSNATASNSGGSLISGATAATYTPVTSTPGTLYYYVVVSGTCTPAITSNVSGAIVVNTPPAITTQPSTATQTVCPNGAASLSVAATGTGVTYQWYSNTTASNSGGSLISGATAATYTPVTSTPGTLYYYVVVSGTCTPAVTSNVSGAIVVNTPPAITTQPLTATQTVCPNGAASLSVAATGTGVTYQWYSNTTASNSGGSLISGATAATYTPVTSTPGTLYYYVVVSGTCTPAVTSNVSGAIVVNTPPAITTQPLTATQTVCPNGAASLSVAATGTGVTYQWYSNATASNSGGSLISGATAATYTPVTSTPGTLYYYVVVSGTCTPAVTSNVSGAIVVNTPPAITTQPLTATQTVCPNGAASLSVAATGTGVTYQWYSNTTASNSGGSLISGATGATYTPVTSTPGTSYYYVVVGGSCTPGVTSDVSGAVTVNAPPAITGQPSPASQVLCINSTSSQLSVVATGTALTYQWYSNTVASNSGGTAISGAISSTYSPVTTTPGTLYYYVVVSGTCTPTATSNVSGAITVNNPPAITTQPASQTVCSNTSASFTVAASGTGPLTYAWYKGTTLLIDGPRVSGATTATLTLSLLNAGSSGDYSVVVSDASGCASVTSNPATLTVNQEINVTSQPAATQTLCEGSNVTFNVTANGTGPFDVKWYNGTTLINNSPKYTISANTDITTVPPTITTSLTINSIVPADASNNYYVIISNPIGVCPNEVSNPASLVVNSNSTISLSSAAGTDAQTKCINTAIANITYTIAGGGTGATITAGALPAGVTGTFSGGVFSISGAPTVSGTFNYTVTTTGPCVNTSASGTITVTPNNTITLSSAAGTNAQTKCINTPITDITYSTTGATGATFSGLPAGVTGSWAANVVTISGSPTTATGSPSSYTVTLTGGCGNVTASGTITVTPDNTITLSSAAGTNAQTKCINTSITDITYSTTGATGATFSGLPAGVTGSWAANVVTISGSPTTTAGSPFNYTVTLTGGCGNVTASGTITVTPNNTITFTSAAGTDGQTKCINTPITDITYSTTGATGATFSGLPAGVTGSWAANVVTISGSPSTATGSPFNYTVTLTGGCGTVIATGTITVTPNNTITLTSGAGSNTRTTCINTPITDITYSTTGATGATFSGLPAGVTGSWASNVVTISGTPTTTAGSPFNYTVTLTGGCGTVTATGTITVTPNNTITLTSGAGSNTRTTCINTPITDITYSTTGATGATFSGLPAGVTGSWAANVVTISGTPTTTAGSPFNYTVTLTGGCGTVTATGTITVTPNNTITLTSGAGSNTRTTCINTPITDITYSTTGATGATFSGLPAGVTGSWAANVVTISGTPSTTAGSPFNYTVTLTGGCGTVTATGTITVTPNNTITLTSGAGSNTRTTCINTPITNITYSTTGATDATFSGLPAGVTGSWSANVVTISGTPSTTSGSPFNYTVTLTGGCGTVTATGTITVTPNNTITLTSGAGSNTRTTCINTPITNITYSTTGATNATFSGLPAGVTGSWAANVVTISGTPTTATGSPFNYTVTLTGGCGTVTATGTIAVTPNNTITLTSGAGSNTRTTCINTPITDITYSTTGATGATFSGLPTGVTGSWAANVVTISGTPSTTAGSPFDYTVTLTGGCGTVTATGTITVTPNNTITLTSGAGSNTRTTCINTPITNITYSTTGATGATFSGLPAGVTGTWAANVVTISGTPTTATGSPFNYIVTLTGGCGIVTATGTITVSPAAVGGTLSPASTTVCSGSGGTINLTGQTGSIVRWESSVNAGSTWSSIANTTATLSSGNLTQTTLYRAVLQSGECKTDTYSSISVIAVNPPFTPTVTGVPSGAICLGSTVTLSANDYAATSTIADGDFGQANPDGWSGNNAGNNNDDPNSNWGEANKVNLTARTYVSGAPSTKKFMIVTGNASPGNNNISTLSTPVFSTVGLTSAKLEWYQGYNFNGSASGTVQISIDGGSTFSNLIQFNSSSPVVPTNPFNTKASVDLTAYLGQSNLVVRFYYVGTSNSNWAIDDVSVPASYVPLSYAWSGPGLSATTGQTVMATPTTAGTNTYTVVTSTGNCGATTTTTYTVVVNPVPVVSNTTTATCSGTAFSITPSGVPTGTTYKWTAPVISPANSITGGSAQTTGVSSISQILTNTTANPATATYTVTPTSGTCAGNTFTVTVTVNPTPTVTTPNTASTCSGSAPNISLTASAASSFTWTIGTISGGITGASAGSGSTINQTLTNPNTTAGTVQYIVRPTSTTGSCLGAPYTITVTVNPSLPVSVSISTPTTTICQGAPVTFTATPTNGGTTPSYQWQVNGVNAGTNSSTFTPATPLNNNDVVKVILTSNATPCATGNPATSNSITMTVNPNLPVSVSIATPATTICQGAPVTFTATPTNGGTTPSYQWQVNGVNAGTNSNTFTPATPLNNNDIVKVILTSNATPCATGNPATSNSITMTVNPNLPVSVSIATPATTICQGAPVTFTATPTNGGTTPSYQWQVNGVNAGTNSNTFTPATPLNNNDIVKVILTSNATPCATGNPATSNSITIAVNPLPTVYNVTGGGTVCSGGSGVSIDLSGSQSGVTYQLYNGQSPVGTAITGTGSPISFPNQTTAGTYTVVATGSGCPNTMNGSATITVGSSPSIANQSITVCSEVPFNLSPAPAGTTYTWSAPTYTGSATGGSAQPVAQTSINQTLVNNELTTGTATYTVTPTGGSCPGNTFTITVTVNTNTWNGSVSTDWSTDANWCSNKVPTQFSSAIIPSGLSRYPILREPSYVKSISIQANTTVTLAGQSFNIYGDVVNTGILVSDAAATLAMNGAGSGTLYFAQAPDSIRNVIKDLTMNTTGTFTIGNQLYILNELVPKNGTLNANGNLTIRSTSVVATARVAEAGATARVIGDVTVERFIPEKRAFRYLSPSVTTSTTMNQNWMEGVVSPSYWSGNVNPKQGYGTHITGKPGVDFGFDYNATGYSSLFYYDNVRQVWDSATTTYIPLKVGNPWRVLVRGSRSVDLSNNEAEPSNTILRAKGTLKIGPVVYDNTGANGTPIMGSNDKDYSLIGNPYASAIDFDKIFGASTNIAPTYWVWDPYVAVRGAYVNYNIVTGTNNLNSGVDSNIQSGQAFFVQASAPNPKLMILESHKTNSRTLVFRQRNDRPKVSVQLLINQNPGSQNTADGFVTVFDDDFNAKIGDEDSYKITNQDENMGIDRDGVTLSIEGRPIIKDTDSIPLKMWRFRQNSYFLKVNEMNFSQDVSAYIKDAYLRVETPVKLNGETTLPFTLTSDAASSAPNRFTIVFKASKALPVVVTDIKASLKDKAVKVEWTSHTETNIDRYEIERSEDGQNFVKQGVVIAKGNNSTTQLYEWLDQSPTTGTNFYRIKVIEKSGEVKYTAIVKVEIARTAGSITVYPNPVKGNRFTINLKNMEKGRYIVMLYNNAGQIVFNTTINHDGRNAAYPVTTKVISKGSYQLHISNDNSKKTELLIFE